MAAEDLRNKPCGGRYGDIVQAIGHTPLLELRPDPDTRLRAQALEFDKRRVADGLDDVPISSAAWLVLKARGSHSYTKCSEVTAPAGAVVSLVPASERGPINRGTSRSSWSSWWSSSWSSPSPCSSSIP